MDIICKRLFYILYLISLLVLKCSLLIVSYVNLTPFFLMHHGNLIKINAPEMCLMPTIYAEQVYTVVFIARCLGFAC